MSDDIFINRDNKREFEIKILSLRKNRVVLRSISGLPLQSINIPLTHLQNEITIEGGSWKLK